MKLFKPKLNSTTTFENTHESRLLSTIKYQRFIPSDYDNISMADVIYICQSLNKGHLIVEVFSKDPLNQTIAPHSEYSCFIGNHCFHVVETVDFLSDLNINTIRHICIYTILKPFDTKQNIKDLIVQSPFRFVDDNYMEILEFNICSQAYDPQIISSLSQKFFGDKIH